VAHAQAADCLAVAGAFPKVRFNLAHSLAFHARLLREAAGMPNVWVDCSALLIHCRLAREDHPIAARREERVDADYTRPADVLETIHGILGERYLWGSDNPYMSWCDDDLRVIYSYPQEANVLHSLSEPLRLSMGSSGPQAWLFGKELSET
jgi:predicted TIM-barrel fold metal-dependent hydrolase